jgi:hypothetical protein
VSLDSIPEESGQQDDLLERFGCFIFILATALFAS